MAINRVNFQLGKGKTPDEVFVEQTLRKASGERKEIAPLITAGPPGVTGFSGGRPKAQEIISYWPTLIPKELVKTEVDVK